MRLVIDEGKTVGAVARELDLTPSALATWVRQARADRTKGKTGLTTEERADLGRWCADAGRPPRFKPSSPSPPDAVRDGSAKLGHPVQNVTREHGLTPLPR